MAEGNQTPPSLPYEYSFFSQAAQKNYKSPDGGSFIKNTLVLAKGRFEKIKSSFSLPNRGFHLDEQILKVALQAAYVDYEKSKEAMRMGKHVPYQCRAAAAVACWINRFCPIQFSEANGNDNDLTFLTLNSLLAWETAWGFKWCLDNHQYGKHKRGKGELTSLEKQETDPYLVETLIEAFIWRNPSFEDLIAFFEIMPPRNHLHISTLPNHSS